MCAVQSRTPFHNRLLLHMRWVRIAPLESMLPYTRNGGRIPRRHTLVCESRFYLRSSCLRLCLLVPQQMFLRQGEQGKKFDRIGGEVRGHRVE